MIRKALVLIILAICTISAFARNPGIDGSRCVSDSVDEHTVTLTNNCSEKVFVIWCGDLKYSKDNCGDYADGGFYTHSNNILPDSSISFEVKDGGSYTYGACMGGISFGKKGYFEDYPNGRYTCLAQ